MKTPDFLDADPELDVPKVVLERQRALEGRQVFSIWNTGHFCLINLPIYEDGVVDCGGLMDLTTFALCVLAGEVTTMVPEGEWLSFFHLGDVQVRKGDWRCKPENYVEFVRSIVKEMNPWLKNIAVGLGYQSKQIGNVRHTFLGGSGRLTRQDGPRPSWKQYYADQTSLFERVETGLYRLVNLVVYADGKVVMVGGSKPWVGDRAAVQALADQGRLHTQVPVGATVVIAQVGRFMVGECKCAATLPDKILEIDDMVAKLNGRPDSAEICLVAYEAYLQVQSPDRLKILRDAYARVPAHLRIYILGDLEAEDGPIRAALGERVWADEEE
jgi:hypothetical protein